MKKIAGALLLLTALLSLTSCPEMRNADDVPDYDGAGGTIGSVESGFFGILSDDGALTPLENDPLLPMAEEEVQNGLPPVTEPADRFWNTDITFAAVGDNLIHPNLYYDAYNRGSAEKRYDFLPLYENVASLIAAADLAYINQETPMAGEAFGYSGWPNFNSPQQLGIDMVEVGFDIVSIANNHMLDKGASGYAATLDFWHTQPVTLIGGYYNEADAAEIRVIETEGASIALLAYTYGTNGISLPWGSELYVPYINDERIVSDLAKAKEISDFIIVSMHWGNEGTQTPTNEQRRLAMLLADNGADVILGSHSHTLQPLEWIHSEVTGKDVLCIYSLGNFASGQAAPVNMVGGILTFRIKGDGDDGLCLKDVLFYPTVNFYDSGWYSTKLYHITDYTDEVAAKHGVQWQGNGSLPPEKAMEYVKSVIPAEFLPEYLR